jgi:hypothetical protein
MSGFSGQASNNTAVGAQSLQALTNGFSNSAFGTYSLFNNTSGGNNAAFGSSAMTNNTSGSTNAAFGRSALAVNSTGSENSAFGPYSLSANTSGTSNAACGPYAMKDNTNGYYNAALGYHSLQQNTTGHSNSTLGSFAGSSITTGANNVVLGYNAQVPDGTASNQVRIGNDAIEYAGVEVPWTITSDRRRKSNIVPYKIGLDFVSRLNPVSYSRINDERQRTEYGFVAQEVEKALRETGMENTGMLTVDSEGIYQLRYNDLLAPMVKAIQELKAENDGLKKRLAALEAREKENTKLTSN